MDLTPDKLRELADDMERYQQLPSPVERASWLRAIAIELRFFAHRLADANK